MEGAEAVPSHRAAASLVARAVMSATVEPSPYSDAALVDTYDRLAVPLQFAMPARDLVAAMELRQGDRVLDAGTGTGATAIEARTVVGPRGLVIGVDASFAMVERLARKHRAQVAAGRIPGLPFRANTFDAVTASFVLAHVADLKEGLADLVRVLRPGARLGLTSWDDYIAPASALWRDAVGAFTNANEVRMALHRVIPWEQWLARDDNIRGALRRSGLRTVSVCRREYAVTLDVSQYLSMKQASVEGVILRRRLGADEWARFRDVVSDRFRARFGARVTQVRAARIAVGIKPSLTA